MIDTSKKEVSIINRVKTISFNQRKSKKIKKNYIVGFCLVQNSLFITLNGEFLKGVELLDVPSEPMSFFGML